MKLSNEAFPNAPKDWDTRTAEIIAREENIELTEDHWELIRALQEYYKKVQFPNLRQVKDALEEKFHAQGGLKYLHKLMPGGPVAQGCKLAGLQVPAGAVDKSFGSVA